MANTTAIAPQVEATVTPTYAEIAANTTATVAVTVPGVKSTMKFVLVTYNAALNAGLIEAQPPRVTAANTVTLYLRNETGAPITPTASITVSVLAF